MYIDLQYIQMPQKMNKASNVPDSMSEKVLRTSFPQSAVVVLVCPLSLRGIGMAVIRNVIRCLSEEEPVSKRAVQLTRVHTVECKVCLCENDFSTPLPRKKI